MAGGNEQRKDGGVDDYDFYLADDDLVPVLELDDGEDDEDTPTGVIPRPPEAVPTQPRRRRSLIERAPKPLSERAKPPRKMTAMEALQAAQEEEERRARAVAEEAERVKKAALAKELAAQAARRIEQQRIEEEEQSALEEAEWARQAFGSTSGPGVPVAGQSSSPTANRSPATGTVEGLPEGARVVQTFQVIPAAVVGPLMTSHQVRAAHEGDLQSAIAFGRIKDGIENAMVDMKAARVRFGGQEWAVWFMDDEPVGAFTPADLYLVGL